MPTDNLHTLPKVRDRLSYLYVEHARIDQEAKAIAIHNDDGITPVPCASIALLLLGPGTRITHAAILALADNGCMVVWCGEEGVRFYAGGSGITRHATYILRQAALCARKSTRLQVVRNMYQLRFDEELDPALSLEQIRGKEGVRVRDAYARMSRETGVTWNGRNYQRGDWRAADPVNRALSTANACLYGVCHAAIVAAGYSPALGFVHTGKQLSFVYDVADFYKADLTIPAAFEAVAESTDQLERRVRHRCRDYFAANRLLERVIRDIDNVLQVPTEADDLPEDLDFDADPARPGGLWDPDRGSVAGGENHAELPSPGGDDPGIPPSPRQKEPDLWSCSLSNASSPPYAAKLPAGCSNPRPASSSAPSPPACAKNSGSACAAKPATGPP